MQCRQECVGSTFGMDVSAHGIVEDVRLLFGVGLAELGRTVAHVVLVGVAAAAADAGAATIDRDAIFVVTTARPGRLSGTVGHCLCNYY